MTPPPGGVIFGPMGIISTNLAKVHSEDSRHCGFRQEIVIPTLFQKSEGDIVIASVRPSVRSSVRYAVTS